MLAPGAFEPLVSKDRFVERAMMSTVRALLFDNEWMALTQDHATLITEGIALLSLISHRPPPSEAVLSRDCTRSD
jgi:hypothetical protein